MPARPHLADDKFSARLEHAFRLRHDGHLSIRAAATIAGIAASALQRWEKRLSGAHVRRGSIDTARAALAVKRAAIVATRAAPQCVLVQCQRCQIHVMDDGKDRWDVVGDLPIGSGVLCVPHGCQRMASVPPSRW